MTLLWGLVEVLARILWMPSLLLHESAMIRDHICPSSNKGGCLLTHPKVTAMIRDQVCISQKEDV